MVSSLIIMGRPHRSSTELLPDHSFFSFFHCLLRQLQSLVPSATKTGELHSLSLPANLERVFLIQPVFPALSSLEAGHSGSVVIVD